MTTHKPKKKNFSSFDKKQAFKQLNLTDLLPWTIEAKPIAIEDFFQKRLDRLRIHFDLESCEESKKLLIDAICEEAIDPLDRLKIWKGASLESDVLCGSVDYLLAERKRYLEAPILGIVEAKKDDFEQGLAQCLVEMQACQWTNQQIGKSIDVFGIVTNGDTWRFYKLIVSGDVYETLPYSINDMGLVLGLLRHVFENCHENLIRN
jgi:hypothetical protein